MPGPYTNIFSRTGGFDALTHLGGYAHTDLPALAGADPATHLTAEQWDKMVGAVADIINQKKHVYDIVSGFGADPDAADNGLAIRNAVAAANEAGGGIVFVPPRPDGSKAVYTIAEDGATNISLDLLPNVHLFGVPGRSWLRHPVGLDAQSLTILRLRELSGTIIDGIGWDGAWGNAVTRVSIASNEQTLPQATINAGDTSDFPAAGTFWIVQGKRAAQQIAYTGKTDTSFTGCSGGEGTIYAGDKIFLFDDDDGHNHADQNIGGTQPKNYGLKIDGCENIIVSRCRARDTYGDLIRIAYGSDVEIPSRNIVVRDFVGEWNAWNGVTFSNTVEGCLLDNCYIDNTFGTSIDSEPVNGATRNIHVRGGFYGLWCNPANPDRSTNLAISIQGGQGSIGGPILYARGWRLENVRAEGSIVISSAQDVNLVAPEVVCDFDGVSYPPILIEQNAQDIVVDRPTIYDRCGQRAGENSSIAVRFYANGSVISQPGSVTIIEPTIYHQNGRDGVRINGTGGRAYSNTKEMRPDSGNATGVTATTVTDASAAWVASQFVGMTVKMGGVQAAITANDATSLTFAGGWKNADGSAAATPAAGAYTIGAQGTASAITDNTLTDPAAAWAVNQWEGWVVKIGGVLGSVLSNTATVLTLDVPLSWSSGWHDWRGQHVDTPAPGDYTLDDDAIGYVTLIGGTMDGVDQGFGAGGHSVSMQTDHSGMRVRVLRPVCKDPTGAAIYVKGWNAQRSYKHLEIVDPLAFDTRITPLCTSVMQFSTPFWEKMILRGAIRGEGVPAVVSGLTSGTWLEEDGIVQRWAGYGAPAMSSPDGSTYRRLDGGAGTTLYARAGGAWSAYA